jgi:hypothetical protein
MLGRDRSRGDESIRFLRMMAGTEAAVPSVS